MKNSNETLFLTQAEADQQEFLRVIENTARALVQSFHEDAAYAGPEPNVLRSQIQQIEFLPDKGMGFDQCLADAAEKILPNFLHTSSTRYMAHLHSAALVEAIAAELVLTTFNQSMDSWDQSPVATELENEACRQLCKLYGYGPESDGIFTSGGSLSNQYGIHLARDWYCREHLGQDVKAHGLPADFRRLRIYTSEISHFSVEKTAHLLGLGYDAVVKVPVNDAMQMDADALERLIKEDLRKGNLPFCVVATVGTTDFGSIDPIAKIAVLCKEHGLWLHCDAAYGSGLILSKKYAARIADLPMADSITVDFHKMFLMPISGSVFLVKRGTEFETFELHADYLNREEDEEDGYLNLVGKSLQTTRRFDALKVWFAFRTRGKDGWDKLISTCVENAAWLYERLMADPKFTVAVKPEISSVVFRLNASDDVNKRVRRALLLDKGIVIGQTVVNGQTYLKFTLLNPLLTHEHLEQILQIIVELG